MNNTRPGTAQSMKRPATAPLEPKDLRQTFLPPPPEKLKQSALYTTLPEAALHSTSHMVELTTAPEYTPGDGRRLPNRLARQRIQVRPRSAMCCPLPKTFSATSYALHQEKEIQAFQAERIRQEREVAVEREQRWQQMRAHIREKEQAKHTESTQRKKMRLARQQATQQLRDQHATEREVLSYDERRTRTGVETGERKERINAAYGVWKGALDINFSANALKLQQQETLIRRNVLDDYVHDTEARGRIFIQRHYLSIKTNILTLEKAERITMLKKLAAKASWKAHQDGEVTVFMTQERRARQRLFDEEANTFFVIEQQKKDLLQRRDQELRREAERRLSEIRAFEAKQAAERRELDKLEQEVRNNNIKSDEANGLTQIRALCAQSKIVALERTHKRKAQEEREWQQECQRQMQPIMENEESAREELSQDELAATREIDALRQQQWEDLLVPISFSITPPKDKDGATTQPAASTQPAGDPKAASPVTADAPIITTEVLPPLHRVGGSATPIFPGATFKAKKHSQYFKEAISSLVIQVKTLEGMAVGDEMELHATEVLNQKEKARASTGLRVLDGSVLDEDNTVLCTMERGADEVAHLTPVGMPAEEMASADMESDILAAMQDACSPSLSMKFTNVDKEGLTKVVERCLQSIVFKTDSMTNTQGQQRVFMVRIDLSYDGAKKQITTTAAGPTTRTRERGTSVARKRSLPKDTPQVKTARFTLSRQISIRVEPSLCALSVGGTRLYHHSITYDVRKKPEGTNAKPMYVPLFPLAGAMNSAFSSTQSMPDFGGGSIKFRYVEGYQADDQFHFANTDAVILKRDDLKFDGVLIAKVIGRMLPIGTSSTREVTFNFLESGPVPLSMGLIERLLSRVSFGCTSQTPTTNRRSIEVVFTEPKKGTIGVPASGALKVEVIVIGTQEQNLTVLWDENNPIILRDATTTTPEHLRHFLKPSQSWIAHNVVLDSHNNFATRDQIAGGFLRATVINGARQWDTFQLRAPPSAVGGVAVTPDDKVMWAAHSNTQDVSHMTCVGKFKKFEAIEGKLRPGIEIDLVDGKLASLQLLTRSLVFVTEATKSTIGCVKTVLVELFVPEAQARKVGGAVGATPHQPTRFIVNVKVVPSALTLNIPNNLIKIPRTNNIPVALGDVELHPDCFEDIFDGGCLKVAVIEGSSSMEEMMLDLSESLPLDQEGDTLNDDLVDPDESTGGLETPLTPRRTVSSVAHRQKLVDLRLDPGKDGQLLLMKAHAVVGTVAQMIDSKPFTTHFGGRRRFDNRLDVKFDAKAPVLAKAKALLPTILAKLSYLHHESDPFLTKTLRLTAEDTHGRMSQLVVQLDVVPVHLPSELEDQHDEVYFRPMLANLSFEGLLPLFTGTTIIDEDTEKCGDGTMSIEPFTGTVRGDVLGLINPTLESSLRLDSAPGGAAMRPASAAVSGNNDATIRTTRTVISWDGDEIGHCVDSYDPSLGTNRLKMTLNNGTPLEACTALMRQIGFVHKEKIPQRIHERQYEFRFNAGDEDVPDTKHVFALHVGAPLIYTLPLYENLTYKEGQERFTLFPRPLMGITGGTSIKVPGDVVHFHCTNALPEDIFWFDSGEADAAFFVEKNALVMSVSAARRATGKLAMPSHGYSGVKLGSFVYDSPENLDVKLGHKASTLNSNTSASNANPEHRKSRHESAEFTIVFEDTCEVPASVVIPAIATRICYKNSSLGPAALQRNVRLVWCRMGSTGEHGLLCLQLNIESQDDMTEVEFPKYILTCFEGERCLLAEGATVTDTDTETFAEGSSLSLEVMGGTATDTVAFNPANSSILIAGNQLLFQGKLVATLDDVTTKKRLVVNFIDCLLTTVESLVQSLTFSTDHLIGEKSKLLTLTVRGSAEVQPTTCNLQVNVHRRIVDLSKVPSSPSYTLGQPTPILLFGTDLTIPHGPDAFGGALLSVCLVPSTPTKIGRRINNGVDRLILGKVPEHITIAKGSASNKSGVTVTYFHETDNSGISFSFPKVAKASVVNLVKDVLACLYFECTDEEGGVAAGSPTKKREGFGKSGGANQKSATWGSMSKDMSGSGAHVGGPDRGLVCVCLSISIPQVDGGTMTSCDYLTITVG